MTTDQPRGYELIIDRRAERQLDRMNRRDHNYVQKKIIDLTSEPRPPGSRKLHGNLYRLRSGNWRVFYVIDDRTRAVIVKSVPRRNERTYRDL